MKYNTVTELLADRSRWTAKAFGRDINGQEIDVQVEGCVCFCALGAIQNVYGGIKGADVGRLLATIVYEKTGKTIIDVNDQLGYDVIYPLIVELGI